jgi:ribosomal protein L12E/L44/L45/RPP1/RPP2
MLERENILNELIAISPLVASVPRINVYRVDENYFDGIRAELQARIIASNFTTPQNYFDVPEGYFENLPTNILAKIKAQENNIVLTEMQKLSPTIAGIGNKNVYTVPQGYFEQLAMPSIVTAKLVQMGSRSIFKYAAAAVIVGLLGFGTMKFIASTKSNNETLAVVKEANKIIEMNSFDATLANVSDKDLENYLSKNGEDVNAALVAASINDDDITLPEADDYLIDDNALDNFLKENNLKN